MKNSLQRRDESDRQKRIAAELEKALSNVDIVSAKNIGKNVADDLLCRTEVCAGKSLSDMTLGLGNANRSTFPVAVSGSFSTLISDAGTM